MLYGNGHLENIVSCPLNLTLLHNDLTPLYYWVGGVPAFIYLHYPKLFHFILITICI